MDSSKRSRQVFDPIRSEWVKATPEEVVRQKLILMMFNLGYPKTLISVEKELKQLPHLKREEEVPDRRIDVICFAKGSLEPLLLIECKEGRATRDAYLQLKGYNHFVKAPFIAVVDEETVLLDTGRELLNFLPKYSELLCQVQK